jgi:peptidoglycan/LPS O-acetylase OafA/YrhL
MSPSGKKHWLSHVQGLRGLAVLAVVVFHAGIPLPGGYLGVDVFFVVSGYVITALILRELNQSNTLDLKKFYLRRIQRLLPALLVLVAVVSPLSILVLSPLGASQNSLWTGLASVFGSGNIAIQYLSGGYFGDDASVNTFLHTWSLGVEEQFYLLFPLVILLLFQIRKRSSLTPVTIGILSLSTLSATLLVLAFYVEMPFESLGVYDFYSPLGRMWEFGLGAIVATLKPPKIRSRYLSTIGWFLLLSSLVAPLSSDVLGPQQLLAASGSALLIYSGPGKAKRKSSLESKSLVFIGDISYSWYLWHWPIIVFVSLVSGQNVILMSLAAAASIVPAILSYRFVESPIRNSGWGVLISKRTFPKLALLSFSPLAISALLVVQGFFNPDIRLGQEQVVADHAPAQRSWLCALGNLSIDNVDECTWTFGNKDNPIYLIGDSQAGMFAEAAIDSAELAQSKVVISTVAGCPLLVEHAPNEICARFTRGVLLLLEQLDPGNVVISFALPGSTEVSLAAGELTQTVLNLQSIGHNVLFLEAVPNFAGGPNSFNPLSCTFHEVAVQQCGSIIPRAEAIEQGKLLQVLFSQVESKSDAQSLPTIDLVCDEAVCSTTKNGNYLYKDASHISVFASHQFSPILAEAINKLQD